MTDQPRIVYFGSDQICLPGLRYLHEQAGDICELALVVSQPDRRSGRGKKMHQNPVAAFASENGLPLVQPEKVDDELVRRLEVIDPVLAFVMAYGHFLPKRIREAPRHGMLNFHGSILPDYRGASPVETAIAMEESETGVCLMQVEREMDAGAVADCERVRIEDGDTAPDVRAKVGAAVVPLLERNLKKALSGELEFEEQDHSKASFCRKISKADAALDFNQAASRLDAKLRAFTPWPGGYFDHGDVRIKVGRASPLKDDSKAVPGTVLASDKTLDVATGEGVLRIFELQRPGGRMLPVRDFLSGFKIEVGEVLPSVSGEALLRTNTV